MIKQRTKIRKTYNYLIRLAIVAVTYGFIYRQVFIKHKLEDITGGIFEALADPASKLTLGLVMVMMLLNWGMESLKWKVLISKLEKLDFLRAFQAVLTGVSVSLFTPNRTGDYLGRVFILREGNRVEGILTTIIGSISQLVVTVCVGLFALLAFIDVYAVDFYRIGEYLFMSIIFLVPVMVFLILLFYFNISVLNDIARKYAPAKWKKFAGYAAVFERYQSAELLTVLWLSMARYLIFGSQFYLLLKLFGVELPPEHALVLIPVIYLVMTLVPHVALVDLGVRGSVSLFVIGLYFSRLHGVPGSHEAGVISAATALWLINLVIPAILGTFFVFRLKFFRK